MCDVVRQTRAHTIILWSPRSLYIMVHLQSRGAIDKHYIRYHKVETVNSLSCAL